MIAKGQITITDLNDGADGSQANIFGYDNALSITSGQAFHTPTGCHGIGSVGSEGQLFFNVYGGKELQSNFPAGIYGISGKVLVQNVSGLSTGSRFRLYATMQEGAVLMGSTEINGGEDCTIGVEYQFRLKYNHNGGRFFYLYISKSKGNVALSAGTRARIIISDLKIEHAENLNGICTPFNGLAECEQHQNILRGSTEFGSDLWSSGFDAYRVKTPNIYQGVTGIDIKGNGTTQQNFLYYKKEAYSFKPNTTYCFSVYAKRISGSGKFEICSYRKSGEVYYTGKNGIYYSASGATYVGKEVQATDEWQRYCHVFRTGSDTSEMFVYCQQQSTEQLATDNRIHVCMPKLEEGDHPTDWLLNEADHKGDKGDQGDKGDKGDQGDKGDKGDQGDNGKDAVVMNLTNEMDSFATDSYKGISAAVSKSTDVQVFFGTQPASITVTATSNNGNTLCQVGMSDDGKKATVSVTMIPGNAFTSPILVTIVATYNGGSLTKVMTIQPVAAGAGGTSPIIYQLKPQYDVIRVPKGSTACTPASFTVGGVKTTGSTSTELNLSQLNANGYDVRYQIGTASTASYQTLTGALTGYKSSDGCVLLALGKRGSAADTWTIVDQETIPIVADGKDGDDGKSSRNNLFGYDCKIANASLTRYHAHTANGFVCIGKHTSEGDYHMAVLISIPNLVSGHSYYVSGILLTPIAGTMDTRLGGSYVSAGTKSNNAAFKVKLTAGTTADDGCLRIQLTPTNTQYEGIFGVKNLKVEDADGLTDATPFDRLAADNLPQNFNMFNRSDELSDPWTLSNATIIDKAFNGAKAVRYVGGTYENPTYHNCNFLMMEHIALMANQAYTVSWWQKGTATTAVYAQSAAVQGSVVVKDGTTVIVASTESANYTPAVTGDWQFHYMTFIAQAMPDIYIRWSCEGSGNVAGKEIMIAMPKLEIGDKPTGWSLSESDKQGRSVTAQYSADKQNWHSVATATDVWMRVDDGNGWGSPLRIVGEKGDGSNYTDFAFNASKSQTSYSDNELQFPTWQDSPVEVNDTYPYLWCRSTLKVWNSASKSYSNGTVKYFVLTAENGVNGADGVQPNIFGYDIPLVASNLNIVRQLVHTPDGFAAFMQKTSTHEAQYNSIYLDMGNRLITGNKYAVSFDLFTPYAEGFNIELKSDSMGWQRGAAFSGISVNTWTSITRIYEAGLNGVATRYVGFTFAHKNKTDEYAGLFYIRNLKIEDATLLTGQRTSFSGLSDDRTPQGQNLLDDTSTFTADAWTVRRGSVSSNEKDGLPAYYHLNSGTSEVDVLEQSIMGKLRANTWYTLSYYAKCSGTCYSFVYPTSSGEIAGVAPIIKVSDVDGYSAWTKNGDEYVTSNKGVANSVCLMRVETSSPTLYVQVTGMSESNDYFFVSVKPISSVADLLANVASLKYYASGTTLASGRVVDIPVGQSEVLYVGYAKNETTNTYTDQYSVRMTMATTITGIRVVDGRVEPSIHDGRHVIEPSTDWTLHTVTFRTRANMSGDKKVLFRTLPSSQLYISQPKLEEGEHATPWQMSASDRVGAIPRPCGQWRSGATYVWNTMFRDIVIYNGQYYAVKREHSSVTSVPTTTNDWVNAKEFTFIATDLLLATQAFIENLGVRIVQTGQDNEPRIVMQGSRFQIYGTLSTPSIQMAVRSDGVAVLEFYDANGNKMYDLGPESIISQTGTVMPMFTLVLRGSACQLNEVMSSASDMNNLFNRITTDYYRFSQGYKYSGSVKKYLNGTSESDTADARDGKVFDSKALNGSTAGSMPTGSQIGAGYYLGPCWQVASRTEASVAVYSRDVYYTPATGIAPTRSGTRTIYFRKEVNTVTPCTSDGEIILNWSGQTIQQIWNL